MPVDAQPRRFDVRIGRMAGMVADHKRARWPIIAPILIGLVALPLLYVLSNGPAFWLFQHELLSYEAYSSCYWPIARLSRNCPPFAIFLQWYLELFNG